ELHVDRGLPEIAGHIRDAAGELALDPVELEAVRRGDAERVRSGVEGDRGQRFNPRHVLLGRELTRQQCGTVLPESGHRVAVVMVCTAVAAALVARTQQGPEQPGVTAPGACATRVCGASVPERRAAFLGSKARFYRQNGPSRELSTGTDHLANLDQPAPGP